MCQLETECVCLLLQFVETILGDPQPPSVPFIHERTDNGVHDVGGLTRVFTLDSDINDERVAYGDNGDLLSQLGDGVLGGREIPVLAQFQFVEDSFEDGARQNQADLRLHEFPSTRAGDR